MSFQKPQCRWISVPLRQNLLKTGSCGTFRRDGRVLKTEERRLLLILFCEMVYDIHFKNNVANLQILWLHCNLSEVYLISGTEISFECLSSYCTDITTFRKPQCVQTNQIRCNWSAVRLFNMLSEKNVIHVIPMWAVTWSSDLAASCKFYVYLTRYLTV